MTSPGAVTSSLGSHVDLAATVCALAGVDPQLASATVQGTDLTPVLADPRCRYATTSCSPRTRPRPPSSTRCATPSRGFFDGHTKYARYYGVGGGKPSTGLWGKDPGTKLFDVDCAFDDNDHEWYDHDADPTKWSTWPTTAGRRSALRDTYERMRDYERRSFVTFASS